MPGTPSYNGIVSGKENDSRLLLQACFLKALRTRNSPNKAEDWVSSDAKDGGYSLQNHYRGQVPKEHRQVNGLISNTRVP